MSRKKSKGKKRRDRQTKRAMKGSVFMVDTRFKSRLEMMHKRRLI